MERENNGGRERQQRKGVGSKQSEAGNRVAQTTETNHKPQPEAALTPSARR